MVIVWGGASGLSVTTRTLVNHGSDENDRYGQALAAGDLDADGDADAAVGGTGKFSLRIVEGPYTRTGEFTGGSTSLASGVRPFDQSYGVEYLSADDILNAGCDNLVIHGREKGTDDALTAVADTRTGNYSDWLETDCESISPALCSTWRPSASPALPAQSVMDAFDGAAGVPPREVPVHRRPQG